MCIRDSHRFTVTGTDGGWIPEQAQWPEVTTDVPVGAVRVLEFVADNVGDWSFHCHKSHHTMGAMGHNMRNMLGVKHNDVAEALQKIMPDNMVMAMGATGMGEMSTMSMPLPENTLPMMKGLYGPIEMGGMFTVLKVRDNLPKNGEEVGWYEHPTGTIAKPYKL